MGIAGSFEKSLLIAGPVEPIVSEDSLLLIEGEAKYQWSTI